MDTSELKRYERTISRPCPRLFRSLRGLSAVSDFQSYIHIRTLAIYIVGIELLFTSAFQHVAFAAQLTVVQAFPCMQYIVQSFFSCRRFNRGCCH